MYGQGVKSWFGVGAMHLGFFFGGGHHRDHHGGQCVCPAGLNSPHTFLLLRHQSIFFRDSKARHTEGVSGPGAHLALVGAACQDLQGRSTPQQRAPLLDGCWCRPSGFAMVSTPEHQQQQAALSVLCAKLGCVDVPGGSSAQHDASRSGRAGRHGHIGSLMQVAS